MNTTKTMKKEIWYNKYLSIFGVPYTNIPNGVKQEIAEKLKATSSKLPLASVVLIAHNEEDKILSCLWSLVDNICDFPIEIIVVSNASTDATENILDEMGVTWFPEEKRGPGHARQCGLDHARGKYYICIDSDTIYPPYYIATHVHHLQRKGVVCTYGSWSFIPDEKYSGMKLSCYEFMRDCYLRLQNIQRPELCVRGMTMAFNMEFGRKIGFRTHIIRGEDGMMALGLKKYGKLLFLKTKKVRPVTSNSTLSGGGSLWQNMWERLIRALSGVGHLFVSKSSYKDRDYNLINSNKDKQEEDYKK